jgi:hypothetical protein
VAIFIKCEDIVAILKKGCDLWPIGVTCDL